MASSHETCLLCLQTNVNTINFYSETGKELNIISILSTHFWFQLDEIKVLSQNICGECWKKTESFHDFYQSVQLAHKKFETVFVKIENDLDIEVDGEIYLPHEEIDPPVQEMYLPDNPPHDNFITSFVKIEHNRDADDNESSDTSVCEVPYTNSIDTETRAFDLLPKRSQDSYINAYNKFSLWKADENIDKDCFSEAVMLEYFHYLKSKYKPSTLFGKYSMLRTTIQKNDNVDISYPEVMLMLKKSSEGFQSQKSNIFQPNEIQRFFSEAPDIQFLAVKVVMIFFVYGIRSDALTKVDVNDVVEQGSVIVIKIPEKKTNTIRSFTVENEYAACIRKYKYLRPANVQHDRFFLNYQKGKCTLQPIGRNKFLNTPKIIANFLKLENTEGYTWYSFRGETSKRGKSGELNCEGTEATTTSKNTSSIETSAAALDSLPENSQDKYLRAYDKFMHWKNDVNIEKECFSEAVMLEYFHYLKNNYKPTTLWTEYAMLKATIQRNNNIDIAYPVLKQFLKTRSFGYLSQKTLIFQPAEIRRFLYDAEDYEFLALKVLMIFGIYGATISHELTKVDVSDVTKQGSIFTIKIPEGQTKFIRSFTVEDEYASYLENYIQLRPENTPHSRFFINYQNGKCTPEPIGIHKIRTAPKHIANFLNLKDAASYTCHSFYTKPLKCTRGTRSSKVLNSYIQECLPKKRKISDIHLEDINSERSAICSEDTSTAALTTSTITNKICEDFKDPVWDFLPEKSRERYVRSYENFLDWKTNEKVDKECFSEAVMVQYFNYMKTKYNPGSLWQKYSMLRTTVHKRNNVDISYPELKTLLKKNSIGFQRKKAEVLQRDEILRFLSEAEDSKFLAVKVISIFGFYGALRPDELIKVEVKDVIEQDSTFVIKILNSRTDTFRSFTVENEHATYIQKYKNLRPKSVPHRRFFINYQKGKCTIQPIGANSVWGVPKIIAKFLNLEDADNYLLHSLKREPKVCTKPKKSLEDCNADILNTRRMYHDVSSSDADNYILESERIDFKRSTEAMAASTITSSMNTSDVANTTFQTYHAQSNQVQPYQLLPYAVGAVNTRTNDAYIQSDEKMLWGMQFNNFHNL